MKRLLSVILVIIMICSTFAGLQITSNALSSSGKCGDNVTYTFYSITKSLIISGSGEMYNYSSYGSLFFRTNIKEVIIESGVTHIGSCAFEDCGLISITIPDTIKSIGKYAFEDNNDLAEINISSIESWCKIDFDGQYANPFYYTNKASLYLNRKLVTEIAVPDSITSISNYAFYGCRSLTSITIPASVTSIGDSAFRACSGITGTLTIPDSVTSIGDHAFCGCSDLTSVTIPDSVTSIGDYAFEWCSGLTTVTIPNSVTIIGQWAFSWCKGLTNVNIPNSVTSIDHYAFCACSGLTSLTIPDSVTSIGKDAFDCSNLSSIDIKSENCSIYNSKYTISKNATIIINGSKDVYEYAKKYNRNYICNHVEEIDVATEPTCTKSGLTQGSHCKACGTIFIEQEETEAALGHDYQSTITAPTCTEKGYTTYTCSRCSDVYKDDYTNSLGHDYIKTAGSAATCTKTGKADKYTCSRCGDSYGGEIIAALGHDYIRTAGFAATCTKTGKSDKYTCSRCSDSYGGETIAALGHSYNNAVVTTNPTCTSKGKQKYTCSRCDNSYYEDIAALGHNYQKTSTTYSTCTTRGKNTYTCSRCYNYYTESLPLADHSYNSTNIIKTKAAYQRNGKIIKSKCSVCGAEGSTSIIYAPKNIVLSKSTYTYSGKANKPAVTVKDSTGSVIDSSNYTVAYSNNINAGTAKVTVTFKGDMYEGSMSKTFKISPKKLTTCGLRTVHTYSGKAIVPTPYYYKTVKEWNPYFKEYDIYKKITAFRKNVDYTIKVSGGHKNIGTYTVVIKFKGNYSGTIKKTMQIRPKPVVSSKPIIYSTTSIKVSWSKVKNVSGYVVYRYNNNNNKWVKYKNTTKNSIILPRVLKSDLDVIYCIKTYKKVGKKVYWNDSNNSHINWQYTKPNKPTVKLVNKDFGEFLIKFNRIADHQTQLSDNKAFSNKGNNICVTYRKYASDEVRASQWGSAITYYVRSREFYYSKSGNLVVGPWSDVKKITTL